VRSFLQLPAVSSLFGAVIALESCKTLSANVLRYTSKNT
jgi:hypothetical protein